MMQNFIAEFVTALTTAQRLPHHFHDVVLRKKRSRSYKSWNSQGGWLR
jgi:hypothetical protein